MASDFRACRPCQASCTAWPLYGSHTEAVWQPHRGCVAATQGLLLLYNSTTGAVQQPQGLLFSYNSTIVAAEQARIRPENIESGTNGVGKPPFGLKLCVVRAVHLRMPPACLDCQKTKKSAKKHGFWRFSGPGPHRALFSRGCDALRGGAKHNLHLSAARR